jgi:DNA modification methylase
MEKDQNILLAEANTTIKARRIKIEYINWRELNFLQADNFKEMEQINWDRLKASLVSNNFSDPFKVWQDENSVIWCLDGKHRSIALEQLSQEGYQVPYLLPAVFYECANKQEAAKLVLMFSASYAKITQQGFHDFTQTYQLDFVNIKDEFHFADINFERYEQKFDPAGLQDLNTQQEQEDIDQILNSDNVVIVQQGDIWQLGKHRLAVGSCFDETLVNQLLQDKKARQIHTDPPYNLPANYIQGREGGVKHENFAMAFGEMTDEEFKNFIKQIYQISQKHALAGAIIYLWMDFRHIWHVTQAGYEAFGTYAPKQLCVWNKNAGGNGSFYRAKHELCFVYKLDNHPHVSHLELQERTRYNVWDYPSSTAFNNPDRELLKEHPTPKPTNMFADALLDTTNAQDIVIDWFAGTGTIFRAAQIVGRIAYATEISPKYAQAIIRIFNKRFPDEIIQCVNREVDVSAIIT